MADGALGQLLAMVDEAFDGYAWHGPTLRRTIAGLTPVQARWRPAPGRHNAWEVVLHAAYWKAEAARRLTGARKTSFPLKGRNWFAVDGLSWSETVRLLERTHRELRATIAAVPASKLRRRVSGRQHSAEFTIRGIAAHDLYHAGQIQLLKKMQAG
jgi:DinB superfamily